MDRVNNLRAFRDFADASLSTDGAEITLDEALARWESENQTEPEREDTLRAIREGLADVEAGRVMPVREAIAEIRRKHHLPPLP